MFFVFLKPLFSDNTKLMFFVFSRTVFKTRAAPQRLFDLCFWKLFLRTVFFMFSVFSKPLLSNNTKMMFYVFSKTVFKSKTK